ncbi:hypothetical protein Mapa_000166 [Marchantia paleacea]|nr:hypothetical protein Mapa_000166 [Marchantia paleacea]
MNSSFSIFEASKNLLFRGDRYLTRRTFKPSSLATSCAPPHFSKARATSGRPASTQLHPSQLLETSCFACGKIFRRSD